MLQCPKCSHVIRADAENRLPPWCPVCGSDFKAATPATTAATAAVAQTGTAETAAGEAAAGEVAAEEAVAPSRPPAPPFEAWKPPSFEPVKRPRSLSTRIGMIGGVLAGIVVALLLAPRLFPIENEVGAAFQPAQIGLVAAGAIVGAIVGALVGKRMDA